VREVPDDDRLPMVVGFSLGAVRGRVPASTSSERSPISRRPDGDLEEIAHEAKAFRLMLFLWPSSLARCR
jgi:hypothetical protein